MLPLWCFHPKDDPRGYCSFLTWWNWYFQPCVIPKWAGSTINYGLSIMSTGWLSSGNKTFIPWKNVALNESDSDPNNVKSTWFSQCLGLLDFNQRTQNLASGWLLFYFVFLIVTINQYVERESFLQRVKRCTPLETNVSPENQWLEDVFPTDIVPFWGTS